MGDEAAGQRGPAGRGQAQADPAGRDPAGRDPTGPGPAQAGPTGSDPAQAGPPGHGPARRGPAQANPARRGPAQANPARRGPATHEPTDGQADTAGQTSKAGPADTAGPAKTVGRANQRARTERALVDACRDLIRRGRLVTMPEVAAAALVSEATAYRYFPDLPALLARSLGEDWAAPQEAMAPVADSDDPVERVVHATRFLLTGIALRQGAVRAVIASTITRPETVSGTRPGLRFALIEEALRPVSGQLDAGGYDQLRRDLTVVVSAEALFTLTDLAGLPTEAAIDSACQTAATLTRAAFERRQRA